MVQWLKQFRRGKKNISDGTCSYCGRFFKAEFLKEHGDSLCCIDQDDCLKSQVPEKPIAPEDIPIEPQNTYEDERISAEEYSKLIEKIKKFRDLKDNWDDEHALPISESAITRTIGLLHVLRRRGFIKRLCSHIGTGRLFLANTILNIDPQPEGGIKINGRFMTCLFELIIPPDPDAKFSYFVCYEESGESMQHSQGYTQSFDVIADKIEDIIPNL